MVVLAAAVTNRAGKVLVSRQFMEIKRIRIEGLLAGFAKLVGKGKNKHTLIETDEVRYVYQPLETLYVIIITNPQSNIMEDLDTLRLLSKLIPQYCEGATEEDVSANAFELIFAFDEVVTNGFKEYVTVQQVKTYTTMDSHEERIQKIITHSKINEAKDQARAKAKAIEMKKREARKYDMPGQGGGGMPGFGSGSYAEDNGSGHNSHHHTTHTPSYERDPSPEPDRGDIRTGPAGTGGGMVLGAPGGHADDFVKALGIKDTAPKRNPFEIKKGPSPAEEVKEGVMLVVDITENLFVEMGSDGTVRRLEVKGGVKVTCYSPDVSRIFLQTTGPIKKPFQSRMQPRLDKKKWTKGVLGLKDPSKPFPTGSSDALTLVTWRLTSKDENQVPFTVNCWPSSEGNSTVVSIEYEMMNEKLNCKHVTITIPCPSNKAPEIQNVDGKVEYNSREKTLSWMIEEMNEENSQGSLDFSVPKLDTESFFPIDVTFAADTLYSGLDVSKILHADGGSAGSPIEFQKNRRLVTSKYTIIGDSQDD